MASAAIKGITLKIDGDTTGLVKSLDSVEQIIKKDDAALKRLDKALKLDPTNVDLLAAKQKILAEKTEAVADKMELLSDLKDQALNGLADDAEISATSMAELETQIAFTSASLESLADDTVETEAALNGTADAAEDTGDAVEESTGSFDGFGDAAETAGEVAEAALDGVVTAVAAVTSAAVAAGAAIGSAFAGIGKALTDATVSTGRLADELNTQAKVTGLSTETLQELNYASELLDVSTETITSSMVKMEKQMFKAQDAQDKLAENQKNWMDQVKKGKMTWDEYNEKVADATDSFTKYGISFQNLDGSLKSTEEVFWEAIDVLGQVENETERDQMAMDLFGKSFKDLNPLIEAGSEGFQELADEAHNVGYVMSQETLDGFQKLDDNMRRLDNGVLAVKNSFGQVLLPLLTDLSGEGVTLLQDFSKAMSETGGDISKIGDVIQEFAPKAVAIIEEFIPKIIDIVEQVVKAIVPAIIAIAPSLIRVIGTLITTLADSVSQNSQAFIDAFNVLFTSLVDSITTLLPILIPIAVNLIMTLANALIDNLPTLIDAAIMIIDTLIDSLLAGDNIEKLIQGAVQLLMSLTQSIIDNLPLLLDAAVRIIVTLVEGLTEALPQLIPAAIDAILTLVSTLLSSGCLEQIIGAALKLIVTLASALIDYLPQLIARLPEIIQGIVSFLTGPALPDILMAGVTLLMELIKAIPIIIVELVKAIPQIITCLVEGLGAGIVQIAEVGKNLIRGLWNGISDMAQWIYNKIKGFGEGIVNQLKSFFGIASPSKVFAEIGEYCAEGLGVGFEDEMDSVTDDMEDAASKTVKDISKALEPMGNIDTDFSGSYEIAKTNQVNHSIDYSSGLGRIEAALAAAISKLGSDNTQIVVPVYIGNEKLDTLIVDGIDRYNYTTGGH